MRPRGRARRRPPLVDLRRVLAPRPGLARKVATVRVLHEVGTERKVVSHFNKATKGRLVRALLESGATEDPRRACRRDPRPGLEVELGELGKYGHQLDVVVEEL